MKAKLGIKLDFLLELIVFSVLFDQINSQIEEFSFCLQNRPKDNEILKLCGTLMDNFCSNIQCEPILDCVSTFENNKEIVHNITGRGCCPACVEYIDEDQNCEVGSVVKKCRNGLFCNPSTKQCNMPGVKNRCLVEYHNRQLVQKNHMLFYVEANAENKALASFFEIKYAADIEFPTCDHNTGKYEKKQCRKSKCYCVDSDTGKYTFGLTEDFRAENVTCECSEFFNKKLGIGGSADNKDLDKENMKHYSTIHAKCDSSGDFEALQCINSTCFCVDSKTGKPTDERAVIYGGLSILTCFDEEKAKKLKSKDADHNYQNSCEKQIMKSKSLALHFSNKGTKLRGLDSMDCEYDGNFAAKQCEPNVCNCVNPLGMQMKSYAADRQGGKDTQMECRCAREEYYAAQDKLSFNQLQCDGFGNFNAFQCYEGGRECYCVDEDGSRISTVEPSYCLDQFIKTKDEKLTKEEICRGMRRSLTEYPLSVNEYYKFVRVRTSFEPNKDSNGDTLKPKPLYCESNSQCGCA